MGFKEKYARKKLANLVEHIKRHPVLPDTDKVKNVGVIWQPTQKEAFQYLKNYFNKEQVIFRSFCVFESITNPPEDTYTLTVKDLNFWGIPKPEKIQEFCSIRFDILFCIAIDNNLALDYIIAQSQARFKVGSVENDASYFDLNIKIGQNHDAMYLAKQQIFYLAQLYTK